MTAAGRDVESINEEAVEAAARWIALQDAIRLDEVIADLQNWYRRRAREALAAALPLLRLSDVPGLERQLRDKIAGEIEADVAAVNWAPTFCNGMEWAALIARRGVDAALNIARPVSS